MSNNFPSAGLINGQTVTFGSLTYKWDLEKWVSQPVSISGYLPLTGGTLSGPLTVSSSLTVTGAGTFTGGTFSGDLKTTSTTISTSSTTGALQSSGGLGVVGAVNSGGPIKTTDTTASTNTANGSLIAAGGAGIAGALNTGANVTHGGTANNPGVLTSQTVNAVSGTGIDTNLTSTVNATANGDNLFGLAIQSGLTPGTKTGTVGYTLWVGGTNSAATQYALYVNTTYQNYFRGPVQIDGLLTQGGTPGRNGWFLTSTLTASSGIATGVNFGYTINAAANSDTLVGLYIQNVLNNASKTGTIGYQLYIAGSNNCATAYALYSQASSPSYFTGAVTVNGALVANSTLNVTGNTTLGVLNATAAGFSSDVNITGIATIGSSVTVTTGHLRVAWDSSAENGMAFKTPSNTYNGNPILFYNAAGTLVGYIAQNASTVTYNPVSDARLKEDPRSFDGASIIAALKPYDFAWKSTGERSHGMFAQEVLESFPEVVSREKESGLYGMDYSRLVPVLVRALQQAMDRIAALEGKT